MLYKTEVNSNMKMIWSQNAILKDMFHGRRHGIL